MILRKYIAVCLKRTVTEGASNTNYNTFAFILSICSSNYGLSSWQSRSQGSLLLVWNCPAGTAKKKRRLLLSKNTIATSTRTMRSFCSLGIWWIILIGKHRKTKWCTLPELFSNPVAYSLRASSPGVRVLSPPPYPRGPRAGRAVFIAHDSKGGFPIHRSSRMVYAQQYLTYPESFLPHCQTKR